MAIKYRSHMDYDDMLIFAYSAFVDQASLQRIQAHVAQCGYCLEELTEVLCQEESKDWEPPTAEEEEDDDIDPREVFNDLIHMGDRKEALN